MSYQNAGRQVEVALGPLNNAFKFFVANLPPSTTTQSVREHFAQFGTVNYVKLIHKESGPGKGCCYGFLYMMDAQGDAAVGRYALNSQNRIDFLGKTNVFLDRNDQRRTKPMRNKRSHEDDAVYAAPGSNMPQPTHAAIGIPPPPQQQHQAVYYDPNSVLHQQQPLDNTAANTASVAVNQMPQIYGTHDNNATASQYAVPQENGQYYAPQTTAQTSAQTTAQTTASGQVYGTVDSSGQYYYQTVPQDTTNPSASASSGVASYAPTTGAVSYDYSAPQIGVAGAAAGASAGTGAVSSAYTGSGDLAYSSANQAPPAQISQTTYSSTPHGTGNMQVQQGATPNPNPNMGAAAGYPPPPPPRAHTQQTTAALAAVQAVTAHQYHNPAMPNSLPTNGATQQQAAPALPYQDGTNAQAYSLPPPHRGAAPPPPPRRYPGAPTGYGNSGRPQQSGGRRQFQPSNRGRGGGQGRGGGGGGAGRFKQPRNKRRDRPY